MYTPYAKIWHKESMTIGKNSSFKAYFDARNPIIIHLKYRETKEFKRFFYIKVKTLIKSIPKQLFKLKWKHIFANLGGIISAIIWGLRNRKLSLKHLI